ncbi:hypothetical protein VHEMI09252 [[Torrubiella] hemipterigena]|uniref:Uncharacterized protein n=1 Tax=[Torrubiella] hemipterigena TaxID=1531966 RepID=A0A0A1TQ26_9HYPO|nr:hypothetical protein VHEMI09252 [[Torrubiella] hemipterigena]
MKLSLLTLLLTAATGTIAAPAAGDDPLNINLCGLGLDLDLTPQADVPQKFFLQAHFEDFKGPTHRVAYGAPRDNWVPTDGKGVAFYLRKNVMYFKDKDGDELEVDLGYYYPNIFYPAAGNPKDGNKKTKALPFEARYVCNPVTKKAVRIIDFTPAFRTSPSAGKVFSSPGMKVGNAWTIRPARSTSTDKKPLLFEMVMA